MTKFDPGSVHLVQGFALVDKLGCIQRWLVSTTSLLPSFNIRGRQLNKMLFPTPSSSSGTQAFLLSPENRDNNYVLQRLRWYFCGLVERLFDGLAGLPWLGPIYAS
ncbi:hypothetical protein BS17DRAFT_538279 [Gyrodon lividus]|nr:hypothetical protein BS17DRAFT_538279 [Gyrodon lividus]